MYVFKVGLALLFPANMEQLEANQSLHQEQLKICYQIKTTTTTKPFDGAEHLLRQPEVGGTRFQRRRNP